MTKIELSPEHQAKIYAIMRSEVIRILKTYPAMHSSLMSNMMLRRVETALEKEA